MQGIDFFLPFIHFARKIDSKKQQQHETNYGRHLQKLKLIFLKSSISYKKSYRKYANKGQFDFIFAEINTIALSNTKIYF